MKVRVKNVPLSADDDQMIRTLETSVIKCEVINYYLERLRIDNLLSNIRTGDRIVICKPFDPPLLNTQIEKYLVNINHFGLPKVPNTKYGKCFTEEHTARDCSNGRKSKKRCKLGHKTQNQNDDEFEGDDNFTTKMDCVENHNIIESHDRNEEQSDEMNR
ncbi:unnamed protein product [Mytilus coruscus]|uniref:Uncharacterized protein n=1 Tax=Mytilus coruscus TaxID=42192 RepID=A0A6J8CFX1_MYTCO|nr:unnamed protein product [Mytilus coruscus]